MDASIDIIRRIIPATETYFIVPGVVTPGPEAVAFLARTSGLDQNHQNSYATLINGLVSDGIWSHLDIFYIFATNTRTTALLNLISASFTATENGTVSFTADQGYTGDGSTFYLDTTWKPTNGPNFTQNSAAFGFYDLTSSTASVSQKVMGQDAIANFDLSVAVNSGNLFRYYITTVGTEVNVAHTQHQGNYSIIRTSSNDSAAYENGNAIPIASSNVDTSGAPSAANVYIFAKNGGTPDSFCSDQLSAAWIGGGLTAGQILQLQTRINTYMTVFGINVY